MPFKLIWYIFVLICIVTFIGLNLGNSSDVALWFGESGQFKDVPIFISFFVMYILGALSVIPYILGSQLRNRKKSREEKQAQKDSVVINESASLQNKDEVENPL